MDFAKNLLEKYGWKEGKYSFIFSFIVMKGEQILIGLFFKKHKSSKNFLTILGKNETK